MWGDSEKCQERRDGRERDRNKNAKYRRDAWNKGKWKKIRPKSQNNKSVWSILLTFSNAITMPISLICPKHTSVAAERRTMSPRWLINKSHTQNCWLWVPWNILHTKSSYQMYRTLYPDVKLHLQTLQAAVGQHHVLDTLVPENSRNIQCISHEVIVHFIHITQRLAAQQTSLPTVF